MWPILYNCLPFSLVCIVSLSFILFFDYLSLSLSITLFPSLILSDIIILSKLPLGEILDINARKRERENARVIFTEVNIPSVSHGVHTFGLNLHWTNHHYDTSIFFTLLFFATLVFKFFFLLT